MSFFKSIGKALGSVAKVVAQPVASIAGAFLERKGQKEANKATTDLTLNQMAYQQDNSNTAHQREVADLRAAGLNPILSAGGSGSYTPTGSTAQMQNVYKGVGAQAVSTASGLSGIKLQGAQRSLAVQQLERAKAETMMSASMANSAAATAEVDRIKADIASTPGGRKALMMERKLAPYKGFLSGSLSANPGNLLRRKVKSLTPVNKTIFNFKK